MKQISIKQFKDELGLLLCLAVGASPGYMIGFVLGVGFQTDGVDPGGGATNNLWIIWTAVYLFCMVAEVVADGVGKGRHV